MLGTRGSEAVVPHGPEVVGMFYPLAADSGLPVRRGSWWARWSFAMTLVCGTGWHTLLGRAWPTPQGGCSVEEPQLRG